MPVSKAVKYGKKNFPSSNWIESELNTLRANRHTHVVEALLLPEGDWLPAAPAIGNDGIQVVSTSIVRV